jgi:hypothetical protein
MSQFADGIVWIRIGPQPNIMGELITLAEGLGLNIANLTTKDKLFHAIKNLIGRRYFLFVLDDIWHPGLPSAQDYFNFDG